MSLVDEYKTVFVKLVNTTEEDGEGGSTTTWTEGANFEAALAFDVAAIQRTAQQDTIVRSCNLITDKSIQLNAFDIVKRKADGLILRVTAPGADSYTPDTSSLGMRSVTAEEWKLPEVENGNDN